MKVSGFTFVHNAINSGYPISEAIWAIAPYVDEMVVVDMASTDGTLDFIAPLGVRVIPGEWIPGAGGACLEKAHAMHTACRGDVIWHFEGDEVFSEPLAKEVNRLIRLGHTSLAVQRLQLEQNFQRCRWYPEPVHRVFERGSAQKRGHTTAQHFEFEDVLTLSPENGYLWDFPVMCRDNWIPRMRKQAELWGHEPKFKLVRRHFLQGELTLTELQAKNHLNDPIWLWKRTPFDIPRVMQAYVGRTKYR